MSDKNRIPVLQVGSGEKFVNDRGVSAIKDGIKVSSQAPASPAKPDWLICKLTDTGRQLAESRR